MHIQHNKAGINAYLYKKKPSEVYAVHTAKVLFFVRVMCNKKKKKKKDLVLFGFIITCLLAVVLRHIYIYI